MSVGVPSALFFSAFFAALLFTPLVRRLAIAFELVDRPDAHRKIHRTATAMGGGVAVLAAVVCGVAPWLFADEVRDLLAPRAVQFWGIILGVAIVAAVGLWDDARRIRARYKLLGQIVAACVVAAAGPTFDQISFAGRIIDLESLAFPVTVFWLVACINALNLIDGSDGLASTVGVVLSVTIACMSLTVHDEATALIALALAGALIGFLKYNAPPASIFLGDAGSMSVGLLTGCLSMLGNVKGATTYTMLAPLAMWLIPMMDVGMAVLRRKLTGRSLSATDRSHLHHCLLERGVTPLRLMFIVGGLCAFCGLGGWLSVRFSNSWFAILSTIAVGGMLIYKRIFGYVEFQLAGHRIANFGRQLWNRDSDGASSPRQLKVRMQGVGPWDELWNFLVDAADELQVSRLTLDLNLPWLHEGYHASWMRPTNTNLENSVRLTWPLLSGGRYMGTLSIVGDCHGDQINWIEKVVEFLAEIQSRMPNVEARRRDTSEEITSAELRLATTMATAQAAAKARF